MPAQNADPPVQLIDPRGPRFGAAITSVLLAVALVLGPSWGLPVLIVQTLAFALGVLLGVRHQPWGWLYRRLVRPRLTSPKHLEDARPPRFAQAVGLAFALAGLAGALLGLGALYYVAIGSALAAALLSAIFDFCLGCEIYLLAQRFRSRRPASATS